MTFSNPFGYWALLASLSWGMGIGVCGQDVERVEELVTRVFPIPRDFSDRVLMGDRKDPFSPTQMEGPLRSPGVPPWPKGTGVVLDRRSNHMAIRSSAAVVREVERYLGGLDVEHLKDSKPVVYFDEITFAVAARQQEGDFFEASYRLPKSFVVEDLKAELLSQGILLPDESLVKWDANESVATIRNEVANLDLTVAFFMSIWEASNEAPPFQEKAPFPVQLGQAEVDDTLRELAAGRSDEIDSTHPQE